MKFSKRKSKTVIKIDAGTFFPYSYNIYFMLDTPASIAFQVFMRINRTADGDKSTLFLHENAVKKREKIKKIYERSTVQYRENLQDKFDYIESRMAELSLRKEHTGDDI